MIEDERSKRGRVYLGMLKSLGHCEVNQKLYSIFIFKNKIYIRCTTITTIDILGFLVLK